MFGQFSLGFVHQDQYYYVWLAERDINHPYHSPDAWKHICQALATV
jgi:hypothetical protein